jgi:hypothetical protein
MVQWELNIIMYLYFNILNFFLHQMLPSTSLPKPVHTGPKVIATEQQVATKFRPLPKLNITTPSEHAPTALPQEPPNSSAFTRVLVPLPPRSGWDIHSPPARGNKQQPQQAAGRGRPQAPAPPPAHWQELPSSARLQWPEKSNVPGGRRGPNKGKQEEGGIRLNQHKQQHGA